MHVMFTIQHNANTMQQIQQDGSMLSALVVLFAFPVYKTKAENPTSLFFQSYKILTGTEQT